MPLRDIFTPFLDQPPDMPFAQHVHDAAKTSKRFRTNPRNIVAAITIATTLGQFTEPVEPKAIYETNAVVSYNELGVMDDAEDPDVWLGRALNKVYSLQTDPRREVDEPPNDKALGFVRELLEGLAQRQMKPERIAASIYGGIDVYFSVPGRALAFECLNDGQCLVHGTRYGNGAPWVAKVAPKSLDAVLAKAERFLNG